MLCYPSVCLVLLLHQKSCLWVGPVEKTNIKTRAVFFKQQHMSPPAATLIYSKTSMTRTPMARLPGMSRARI